MAHLKIMFVVRSMLLGGAETQLTLLARGLTDAGHTVILVSLYDLNEYDFGQAASDPRFCGLRKTGRWDLAKPFWRLRQLIAKEGPDIIHGYMPAGNIYALLASLLFPTIPIILGIRASAFDLNDYRPLVAWMERAEIALARRSSLVIFNSNAAAQYWISKGLDPEKAKIIFNGLDMSRLTSASATRKKIRDDLQLSPDTILVGRIGRHDPMKDMPTALRAFASATAVNRDVHLLIVGESNASAESDLRALAISLHIGQRVHFMPKTRDIAAIYASLDVLLSSSAYGEGFPNVILEALAIGLPVVATDVGESAAIVGADGWIAPPRRPDLLAAALQACLQNLPHYDGASVAKRVQDQFSIERLCSMTLQALLTTVQR
jgi:glycosyltransferase involved in cell wall biosynthesis